MADEMFFTDDERSLRRGKRVAPRTDTNRPCLVWPSDAPEMTFRGVIINMSPYGMCVRMLEALTAGTEITVQLMRDDSFSQPLSPPVTGHVVRCLEDRPGVREHGVKLVRPPIHRKESKPIRPDKSRSHQTGKSQRESARMYTIDLTVGGQGLRRTGR